jgi:hypothetical protein
MSNRAARYASKVGVIAFLGCSLTGPALSQGQRPPSEVDPARARFEDTSRREMQLRGMASGPKTTDPKEIEALAAQIKQDFQRIVSLHNLIARSIGVDEVLDKDSISKATLELKKRAKRLQSTLALDNLDPTDQNQHKLKHLDGAKLRDTLGLLCRQIESFITNPLIDHPSTVDARHIADARHDLEGVRELSERISKLLDRARKSVH